MAGRFSSALDKRVEENRPFGILQAAA